MSIKALADISLAIRYPTNWTKLFISDDLHFQPGQAQYAFLHRYVLMHAVNHFSTKSRAEWENLTENQRRSLSQFIRLVESRSSLVWFSDIQLTGLFWDIANKQSSFWRAFTLKIDPLEPVKSLNQYAGANRFTYTLLGHHSFYLNYQLSEEREWNCLVNPHEEYALQLDGGFFVRTEKPMIDIRSFYSIDTVILTDWRMDHYDPQAISFLEIFQPTFFLPNSVEQHHRYLIAEHVTSAKIILTYFPPPCLRIGNDHSGSWVFSFPRSAHVEGFDHIVILGTAECCEEQDFLLYCKEIKEAFVDIDTLFIPIDTMIFRRNYTRMMAGAIRVLKPRLFHCTHFGIWPFHWHKSNPLNKITQHLAKF